jgi:predicted adenine nucleotide alpha hydrolase (AANH) superfamily ATPase
MRVLLHICCGPCAIVPIRQLRAEGHEVDGAFVNPNIHPLLEYRKRLEAAREVCDALGVEIVRVDDYGLLEFLDEIGPRRLARCLTCYRMRLTRVARLARERGYDAFTTTMLVSTQQDHGGIRRVAEEVAHAAGVEFLYRDFRPHVMDGVRESKEMGVYRQQYCGCVYSERERYESGGERPASRPDRGGRSGREPGDSEGGVNSA